MKKTLALILLLTVSYTGLSQSYNLDYGIKLGAANYFGEIGGKDQPARPWVLDMKINQTRWSGGAFLRYRFNHWIGINSSFNYLRIQGADSLTDYIPRKARNLSFRNDIFELSARAEIYTPFLYLADVGYTGKYRTDFQAYLFAGITGFWNNPKANYQGEWYALQPLRTEGVEYGRIQMGVPLGAGFWFTHDKQHRFGFEIGWTFTFTDYIDDISTTYGDPADMAADLMAQSLSSRHNELDDYAGPYNSNNFTMPGSLRGDASDRDSYMVVALSYSYVIKTKGSFYKSNYSWLNGRRGRRTRVKAKF